MDLGKPGDVDRTDAIGAAKKEEFWQSAAQKTSKTEVATLLKRFQENPEEVRQVVRLEISWYNEAAAEIFALVVFVSDGLLQIKDTKITTPAARYFNIARSLPLELQMVLCYRMVRSAKEIIPGKDCEVAFKLVAKWIS